MKQLFRCWIFGVAFAIGLTASRAAESGESVVLVYNKRVPESKGVAEHYAERRRVPAAQILGLDLPVTEAMTRAQFRDQLQKPLYKWLVDKKFFTVNPAASTKPTENPTRPLLAAKIRYVVLCYGVPLKIAGDPSLVEEGTEQFKPELRRNEAAVDSELSWLPSSGQKIRLAGPLPNPFYGATNAGTMHPTNGILLVARLDGPDAAIARGLVDKAMEAETNGLWGRAYFDARGLTNGEYKLGDDWMRTGAQICQRLGFDTVLDDTPPTFPASFPMSHIAIYAGWYDGTVSGPFTLPKVEFMPGAFAYHLHSFSAATLRSTTANWVGPLLARGATITFGSVDEPYLAGTPDVATFLARLIYHRFTFGEAAYAGQHHLSWQTTVVGDPLYRPYLRAPDALHFDLEKQRSPLVEWSHLRVVNLNQATGLGTAELIQYLEQQPVTKQSAVLQEKLGALRLIAGRTNSGLAAYQLALQREPSPQQKIRLQLALAETQARWEQDKEALATYQQLLRDTPTYGNPLEINRRMLSLAQRLGLKPEIEKFNAEILRLSAPAP